MRFKKAAENYSKLSASIEYNAEKNKDCKKNGKCGTVTNDKMLRNV